MFAKCFSPCEANSLLFQHDAGEHLINYSRTNDISYKPSQKRSLKLIKSQKSLKSQPIVHYEAPTPRTSIIVTPNNRKTSETNKEFQHLDEVFRNPFGSNWRQQNTKNSPIQKQNNFRIANQHSPKNQIKITFNFEHSPQKQIEKSPSLDDQQTATKVQDQNHSQTNQQDQIYQIKLTEIGEEKDDLMSTHFGEEDQNLRIHWRGPKSAVSMISDRSDCDSIVMDRPNNVLKLTKLL